MLEKYNYLFFLIAFQFVIRLEKVVPFFKLVYILIKNWSPKSFFLRWFGAGSPGMCFCIDLIVQKCKWIDSSIIYIVFFFSIIPHDWMFRLFPNYGHVDPPHLHERTAIGWIKWKTKFQIFPIFIFRVMVIFRHFCSKNRQFSMNFLQ